MRALPLKLRPLPVKLCPLVQSGRSFTSFKNKNLMVFGFSLSGRSTDGVAEDKQEEAYVVPSVPVAAVELTIAEQDAKDTADLAAELVSG